MAEFEKQPPVALPATARWHSVLRHAVGSRRSLLGAAGWVSATFIAQQTLRLVSNIILAWLLAPALLGPMQIGRASGRERVCPYVEITGVAETLKKKTNKT